MRWFEPALLYAAPPEACSRLADEASVLNNADSAYLKQLRESTRQTLAQAIGEGSDVALLDIPNQRNVGDSLIWAGEMAYLQELGLRVRYASDLWGYEQSSLRRAMPAGTVLLHGGGNLGDLWLGHQAHREQVTRDLRDYKIVQMPQSLYFRDQERAAAANRILAEHPDFHILLRDEPSLDRAARDLPDVRTSFCYDMALGWRAPSGRMSEGASEGLPARASEDSSDRSPDADSRRVLVIARADRESSSGLAHLTPGWLGDVTLNVTDWGDLGPDLTQWRRARTRAGVVHRQARLARHIPALTWPGLQSRIQHNLATINLLNIRAGAALYKGVAGAIVDRLHAHILAALLGVEHVLLDNSYGKLRAVYDGYTNGFSTAHYVTSLDEARDQARQFRHLDNG